MVGEAGRKVIRAKRLGIYILNNTVDDWQPARSVKQTGEGRCNRYYFPGAPSGQEYWRLWSVATGRSATNEPQQSGQERMRETTILIVTRVDAGSGGWWECVRDGGNKFGLGGDVWLHGEDKGEDDAETHDVGREADYGSVVSDRWRLKLMVESRCQMQINIAFVFSSFRFSLLSLIQFWRSQ